MKSKFILVPESGEMTSESVVAIVWVGTSKKECRLLRQLKSICDAQGWWFEKWGEHVDQRLWYENARVFHNDGYFMVNFRKACFSLAEALNFVRTSNLVAEINHRPVTKTHKLMMAIFHPLCLDVNNRIHAISHLLTHPRKYLSDAERNNGFNALLAFGLISASILIGMVLESVERWLLG